MKRQEVAVALVWRRGDFHTPGVVLQRVDQKLVEVYSCGVCVVLTGIWERDGERFITHILLHPSGLWENTSSAKKTNTHTHTPLESVFLDSGSVFSGFSEIFSLSSFLMDVSSFSKDWLSSIWIFSC